MRTIFFLPFLFLPLAHAEDIPRLAVNDLKSPRDVNDLLTIEAALKKVLPVAREATVCLEMKDGSGSGVIVSKDGLILTAAHVSGGVGNELTAILNDGRKVKCESLGLNSETDAAMLRIVDKGDYPFIVHDDNNETKLGDWVFALGHSGGYDKARGVGVRLGRLIQVGDTTVQSDCTLIGGDSGGPLFDLRGQLIAIHSRVGNNLSQNMHVPMHEFIRNWQKLLDGEFIGDGDFVKKPEKGTGFLGLATEESEKGLKVAKIGKDTVAEKADIRVGDVILSLDEKVFLKKEEFKSYLSEKSSDEKVTLKLLREQKEFTITLRLGKR